MLAAFNAIKTALLQSVCLAFPRDNAELSLATDASATHVGAVLQQLEPLSREWRPLGFFPAKLEKAQLSYSAFHRELFGVYAAIRHFRHHLEGRLFTIWTDHKPLTFALSRLSDSWTARQQWQLSYVAEFTNKIFFFSLKDWLISFFLYSVQYCVLAQPGQGLNLGPLEVVECFSSSCSEPFSFSFIITWPAARQHCKFLHQSSLLGNHT